MAFTRDKAFEEALEAVSNLTPDEAVSVLEDALQHVKTAANNYRRELTG